MKTSQYHSVRTSNGEIGRPCSNAKFMHVAGIEGMTVKTSYDTYFGEETTSVYLNGEIMAERITSTIQFPGDKMTRECFLFGYRRELKNA